jgi:hypothetical protein
MDIVINTTRLDNFFSSTPEQMLWIFFINIGWMLIASISLYGISLLYLQKIRSDWAAKNLKFILLAIDVPKGNEQSPKAVENMFTYLAGAHGSIDFFEKWFEGKFQVSFSYEIVSLEGYTQFLIRTPVEFRNLIETSVYSQYPDAEISEVDDYVDAVPHKFPDEEYGIWGAEFIQANDWAYPIKLYQEFEHSFGESETQFKDPMASLMDLCSSLREGEQFWFQMVVIPTGFDWMTKTEKIVDKILNKNKKINGFILRTLEWFGNFGEIFFSIWGDIESKEEKDNGLSMMELTPKQKKQIEAVQMKASKLAFEVKIRMVYISRQDVINRSKVANGFIGYIKQFIALDLNNLMPDVKLTMTRTAYFNKSRRLARKKNALITNYINRDDFAGRLPGIFNIEELATLWHFPIEANVKAPMIQKAPGRKADAPSSLPITEDFTQQAPELFQSDILRRKSEVHVADNKENLENNFKSSVPAEAIPENLPFV